jgi:hypothetical protein
MSEETKIDALPDADDNDAQLCKAIAATPGVVVAITAAGTSTIITETKAAQAALETELAKDGIVPKVP